MSQESKRAYVEALLDEHAGYARSTRPSRVIAVEEELARYGFAVKDGELVPVEDEKPPAKPAKRAVRETAVAAAPERAVDKS